MTSLGDYASWAAAGLTSASGSGLLGANFGRTLWCLKVPKAAEVEDGLLRLSYDGPGDGTSEARKPDGALDDFLMLPDDNDAAIASFARRWGALGLCSCGWPVGHPPTERMMGHASEARLGSPLRSAQGRFCSPVCHDEFELEPIVDWRRQLQRMRAVLTLAAAYYGDDPVPLSMWEPLLATADGSPYLELLRCITDHDWDCVSAEHAGRPAPGRLCDADRHSHCPHCWLPWCWTTLPGPFVLGRVVDEMLDLASIRVRFSWLVADPEIDVEGGDHGLMPHFALQLAMALQRADHLAICSECGLPHFVARTPNRLRRIFCPACRESGAPQRRAARDYRARRRLQHREHAI